MIVFFLNVKSLPYTYHMLLYITDDPITWYIHHLEFMFEFLIEYVYLILRTFSN